MFKVRRERFKGDRRDTLITEGGGNVEQFARGSGRGRALKGHLNRLFMDRKGLAGYETNVGKRTLISLEELSYRTCFCTVSGSCSNTA